MNKEIFRSYDVRGIYGKDISEDIFKRIGNAFASFAQGSFIIACDSRISSPTLSAAFAKGALDAGCCIADLGLMPLGAAAYWAERRKMPLAYVTASHLTKEWNGVKFFHASGIGFMEHENFAVRDAISAYNESPGGMMIQEDRREVLDEYVVHVSSRIKGSGKILIDCGNGATGVIAQRLFTECGFTTEAIFEEPDGNFPNRLSDPREDKLDALTAKVKNFDIGIAFDGDGDRAVLVTPDGEKLPAEHSAAIMLSCLLPENNGPVVANVECSMLMDDVARKFNAPLHRCRVGHTFLMEAVHRTAAVFGVESADHFVIAPVLKCDDALAAGAYMAKAAPLIGTTAFGEYHFKRTNFPCSDAKKFSVVKRAEERITGKKNLTDGVRIDFDDGWVLIRTSNTSPFVRLTVEARSAARLDELMKEYTELLQDLIAQ